MAFSTGFGVGYSVGSDIAAKKAIKKEKERTEKLVEELKTKIEEYQLSGDEISYSEKMQLGVLVSQLGQTYASTFSDINNAQSSFDKEKLSQEAQNLRNKNDMFATLVKEIKDNKYLSQADLSALDEITGAPFSKLWNKDVIEGIRNEETKQQTLDNVLGVYKATPAVNMPYEMTQQVAEQTGLNMPEAMPPATPKTPGITDYKGAADYLNKFINANPETFNAIKAGLEKNTGIDLSAITQQSLKTPEKVPAVAKTKVQDPNDVLFGTNGIMKNYINSGSQLGEEQKAEIRNNYNLIRPSLSADVRTQVEEYLQQIGIDINAPVEAPITETTTPEVKQPGPIGKAWNWLKNTTVEDVKNKIQGKGNTSQQGYTAMSDDELADLALTGDQAAIDELKRRGLL